MSAERTNSRNGYWAREFDTRGGTIELAVPKLRKDGYYPGWLLTRRRRAEQALTQVVDQCYIEGVSTRRVDDIVKGMGIDGSSKSQVSQMAKTLDVQVRILGPLADECSAGGVKFPGSAWAQW